MSNTSKNSLTISLRYILGSLHWSIPLEVNYMMTDSFFSYKTAAPPQFCIRKLNQCGGHVISPHGIDLFLECDVIVNEFEIFSVKQ